MKAAPSKQRGTSRELIVDVSRGIIEDEGREYLTIRRIAETIDRTQPAVYQHFAGKDEILGAVVEAGFVALVERLKRTAKGEPSLSAIANAYVRFGLERPRLYEIMFVNAPVIAFAVADNPRPARAAFEIFAAAIAATGLPPTEVDTVTEVVWAALHGLVALSNTNRLRPGHALHRARVSRLISAIVATSESI